MIKLITRTGYAVTGLCLLAVPAVAHPGPHPAADHSHHFAGFEFAAVALVAALAVIALHRHRIRG